MGASLIDLTFHHACAKWQTVDELEQEVCAAQQRLRTQQSAVLWAEPRQRQRLDAALETAQRAVHDAQHRSADARRRALLLTSRAAQRTYGVQLGRAYTFRNASGEECARFTVDFLRPILDLRPGESAVFVCGGVYEGRGALTVLGRDSTAADEHKSNVIQLGRILHRRT